MTKEAKLIVDTLRACAVETQCSKCVVFCGNEECLFTAAAKMIESLSAELEQVKRERDAAVEDLKDRCYTGKAMCNYCIFLKNGQFCAKECDNGECFEWRGVKEG